MARNVVEDIDAIMAEMEEKTPKPEDKEKSFASLYNKKQEKIQEVEKPQRKEQIPPTKEEKVVTKLPDVVDAKGFWSTTPKPDKPGNLYPSRPTNDRYYDFTNTRVGAALILNQVKVKGEKERIGSRKDADDLQKVLFEIGFDVKVCDDFTVKEIKQELEACKSIFMT